MVVKKLGMSSHKPVRVKLKLFANYVKSTVLIECVVIENNCHIID